jgi:hypothetical protein
MSGHGLDPEDFAHYFPPGFGPGDNLDDIRDAELASEREDDMNAACTTEKSCTTTGLTLAAKVAALGKGVRRSA